MAFVLKIKVRYRNDETGRSVQLPALWTADGLLISLLRYLASGRAINKSSSWKERTVFSVRLLLNYLYANEERFTSTLELLTAFAQALEIGTINTSTLTDPSGLYWSPRRQEDAQTLLWHISHYSDWLSEQPGYTTIRANPYRKSTSTEQRMNWCAYFQKEKNVLLSHLHELDPVKIKSLAISRHVTTSGRLKTRPTPRKRFPEANIRNFLDNGWRRRDVDQNGSTAYKIDHSGRAITILLNYCGLRRSEVFHLYLSDIIVDKKRNTAIVKVYHPADGSAPEEGYTNRRDYLARRYYLKPRHEYPRSEALHAGWKNPLLDDGRDKYLFVHFFPTFMGKVFLHEYAMYLQTQRVDPPFGQDHPYAFTNGLGAPETSKNFWRKHRDAVERIGLAYGKNNGTSPHGHRHAYGTRLRKAGLSEVERQKAMHHKSPESQKVYTEPTDEEISESMAKASAQYSEADYFKQLEL